MGTSVYKTVKISPVTCCNCGTVFGMTDDYIEARQEDKALFNCPNGHQQHYSESEADRLKRQLAALQAAKDQSDTEARRQREAKEATERRLSAQFGENTKLRKRIAAGMCPCCRRPFANLHRHMKNQHPGFKDQKE